MLLLAPHSLGGHKASGGAKQGSFREVALLLWALGELAGPGWNLDLNPGTTYLNEMLHMSLFK